MNHSGGQNGPIDPNTAAWADLSRLGAEHIDLSKIGEHRLQDQKRPPYRVLQQIALEEMEKIDKRCNDTNVVRIGDYYWITDNDGALHLACDTAPVATVKILGMAEVQRLHAEAVRQERQ